MTFAAFLEAAWNDHGDRPQEVADRLAASLSLVEAPENIAPFARLLTHVFGEHLGQWHRGIALLDSLRALPAYDGSSAVDGALTRSAATLRYAGGENSVLASLSTETRVEVLATAASAFAGRKEFGRAVAAYEEALRLAHTGLPSKSPAIRALAVGGNNLAAALEEKADRDISETEGMIVAANGGLRYWKEAGTWLEEERAEYQLARSLLQAGKPAAAIQSAWRCVDICKQNDAPAFEQFRGYAVLALAQRDAGDADLFEESRTHAMAIFGQLPDDEKLWCRSEVDELGGFKI
jgi:tetratricopeptide (TPR) repeat protein